MEFQIDGAPKSRAFIEAVLPSMLEQLKLTQSRKLLHIILDPDLEDHGTTVPFIGLDTYLVVLKPTRNWISLATTLAHELTHVAQFAKGILQVTPKGKRWRGKFYGRNVPYLNQPWEIQAFAKQEIIMRRAIEL